MFWKLLKPSLEEWMGKIPVLVVVVVEAGIAVGSDAVCYCCGRWTLNPSRPLLRWPRVPAWPTETSAMCIQASGGCECCTRKTTRMPGGVYLTPVPPVRLRVACRLEGLRMVRAAFLTETKAVRAHRSAPGAGVLLNECRRTGQTA